MRASALFWTARAMNEREIIPRNDTNNVSKNPKPDQGHKPGGRVGREHLTWAHTTQHVPRGGVRGAAYTP